MIKHKKVSAAAAATDPAVVGGPDWNDDHGHAIGSIFPVAHVRAESWDVPMVAIEVFGLPVESQSVTNSGFVVEFDTSGIPLLTGTALEYFVTAESLRIFEPVAFVYPFVGVSTPAGNVQIDAAFRNADGFNTTIAADWQFGCTVFAVVVAA